jgi:hypothetical protein
MSTNCATNGNKTQTGVPAGCATEGGGGYTCVGGGVQKAVKKQQNEDVPARDAGAMKT